MRLKDWLRLEGLNVRQFAEAMGETFSITSKWVHGQRQPSLEKAVAIERFTNGAVTGSDLVIQKNSGLDMLMSTAASSANPAVE